MLWSCKGFTLIEFLIALVIIGFIVALLVNFFSDPLDEAQAGSAATRIIDELRTIESGTAMLRMKTGCSVKTPAFDGDGNLEAGTCLALLNEGALLSEGVLVTMPVMPGAIFTDGGGPAVASGSALYDSGLGWGNAEDGAFWGASRKKIFLYVVNGANNGVTDAICKEFNRQLGYGAIRIDPTPNAIAADKGAQCVLDGGFNLINAGQNTIVWPLLAY